MKAAQWRMKQKWLDFTGLKILGSDAALPHHWAVGTRTLLTLPLHLCVIRVEPATSAS